MVWEFLLMANAGNFLGCRRIKGEVFIYDRGLKFKVVQAQLVI